MKPLLTLLLALGLASVSFADVATDLAALKKAFPEWVAPSAMAGYNPQDPLVKDCADKYRKTAASLTPANLAGNVNYLRTQLERDIARFSEMVANSQQSHATGAQFYAARANHLWLTKKVNPWFKKLEALAAPK